MAFVLEDDAFLPLSPDIFLWVLLPLLVITYCSSVIKAQIVAWLDRGKSVSPRTVQGPPPPPLTARDDAHPARDGLRRAQQHPPEGRRPPDAA